MGQPSGSPKSQGVGVGRISQGEGREGDVAVNWGLGRTLVGQVVAREMEMEEVREEVRELEEREEEREEEEEDCLLLLLVVVVVVVVVLDGDG